MIRKKVYIDRLLKLAKILRANAKNKKGAKFDLGGWGNRPVGTSATGDIPVNCGTTACAFGLAAISGKFKRSGLSYTIIMDNNLNLFDRGVRIVPTYKEWTEFAAAEKFFGLNPYSGEAQALFDPYYYPVKYRKGAKGELYVAKRIIQFAKTGKLPEDAYSR